MIRGLLVKRDCSGGQKTGSIPRTLRTISPKNCQMSEFCSDIKGQSRQKSLALRINVINI